MSYDEIMALTDEQMFQLCLKWERARKRVEDVIAKEETQAFHDQVGFLPPIPAKGAK